MCIRDSNWTVVNRIAPSLVGFTITGMNGMATDPTDGQTYVIMKVSAVSGRVLGRINLSTGKMCIRDSIENAQEGACVSIYNSLGALVLKLPVQNTFARSVIQISVAEFPAGIYTAVFENENNRNSIIWIKSNQQ